jgi:hypothetical protein
MSSAVRSERLYCNENEHCLPRIGSSFQEFESRSQILEVVFGNLGNTIIIIGSFNLILSTLL